MTNSYLPGTVVTLLFTVKDTNGNLTDPALVRFHYTNPAGTDFTKTYLVDTDVVTKLSTGVYRCLIYVPYATASIGDWPYDAQALDGSSNSLVVNHDTFYIVELDTL